MLGLDTWHRSTPGSIGKIAGLAPLRGPRLFTGEGHKHFGFSGSSGLGCLWFIANNLLGKSHYVSPIGLAFSPSLLTDHLSFLVHLDGGLPWGSNTGPTTPIGFKTEILSTVLFYGLSFPILLHAHEMQFHSTWKVCHVPYDSASLNCGALSPEHCICPVMLVNGQWIVLSDCYGNTYQVSKADVKNRLDLVSYHCELLKSGHKTPMKHCNNWPCQGHGNSTGHGSTIACRARTSLTFLIEITFFSAAQNYNLFQNMFSLPINLGWSAFERFTD